LAELFVNTDADYRGAYEILVRWASVDPQIKCRVFDPFVRSRPDKQALLTDLNEPRPGAQGKHAWLRILDDKANLGDMLDLTRLTDSNLRVAKEFKDWLSNGLPKLADVFVRDEARRILALRNRSEHEGEDQRIRAEEACALCRKYLDCILTG
jgi:hypothetical protein